MLAVLMSVGGVGVLAMFYRTVESKWPQSYMSVGDIVSFRISTSVWRYASFRLAPVFVTAFFVTAVLSRGGRQAGLAVTFIGAGHIALTVGRDLLWTLRRKGRLTSRVMRVVTDTSVLAGIVLALLVGWSLGRQREAYGLVPDLETVAFAFWTALFAAIGGAFLVKATGIREPDIDELIQTSRKSVPGDLLTFAEEQALSGERDIYLVEAILLAENLQRPGWVRRLEAVKGRFFPRGSYGVMQVQSSAPIDDKESIRRAVLEQLPPGDFWVEGEGPDEERLDAVLRNYNPDSAFVELAKSFYSSLTMHRWDEDLSDEEEDS